LSAKEQLVLVLHGDAEGHHPVFDQILAVAEGWRDSRIDELVRDSTALAESLPQTEALVPMPLPGKQRWWKLPLASAPGSRTQESYSSLEKFLYGPNQWVLNYAGKIRQGNLAELSDNNLLKGSLAHSLFEYYFNANTNIAASNPDDAPRWARARLPEMLVESGAVLLTPGRQAEKEDFIDTVCNALTQLVTQLQAANVVTVAMEGEHEGRFVGGKLGGIVDLLATNSAGDIAVVDIKWGGANFRKNSLQKSEYLQLAVYATLCKQSSGKWPALGYFIIDGGNLLCLDTDYFPGGEVFVPENGESVAEFWERVAQTWKWRKAQMSEGLIEVPVDGTVPDEDSSPGEFGLKQPETYEKFSDYTTLTGWGADQ
jgi:ATP-dependent helicase/nuclease subunit B